MPRITGPLADALRDGRERHNARFAAARRRFPALDTERFASLLETVADPIVRAVHARDRAVTRAAADAAHDALLDVVGRDLDLACPAAIAILARPGLVAWIAHEPRRAIASIVNATWRVAQIEPAALPQWAANVDRILEAGPDAASIPDALLVAAWGAGIPMLRAAALDALERLPEPIALASLMLASSAVGARELAWRLRADPWSLPSRLAAGRGPEPAWIIAAIRGGFRGFGGPFRSPPRAEVRHGRLFASAGDERFVVWADRMGTCLESCPAEGPALGAARESITLRGDGRVEGFGQRSAAPMLAQPIASWASFERTLIAIPERSHHVIVIALAEST